jgi:hypothetical protein
MYVSSTTITTQIPVSTTEKEVLVDYSAPPKQVLIYRPFKTKHLFPNKNQLVALLLKVPYGYSGNAASVTAWLVPSQLHVVGGAKCA